MNSSRPRNNKQSAVGQTFRFGLRYKLFLLLALPLATAIFFAGINFTTLLREYRAISGALAVSEATLRIDKLLGGLQRESTLQLALLKRDDPLLREAINQTRRKNTALINEFLAVVESTRSAAAAEDITEQIVRWRNSVMDIDQFRNQLNGSAGPVPAPEVVRRQFSVWIDAAERILSTTYPYRDPTVGRARALVQLLIQAQNAGSAEQLHVLEALAGGVFRSSDASLVARARGVNEDAIRAFEELSEGRPELLGSLNRERAKAEQVSIEAAREDLSYHLQKLELLNKLKVLTGFGGLIDDFKNYVMRGEEAYRDAFEQKSLEVESLIQQMEKLPGYPEADAVLLAHISETFEEYGGYFELVTTLQETDTPVEIIDQSVLVDESLAQQSLIRLDDFHPRTEAFAWWQASADSLAALETVREQIYIEINAHLESVQRRAEVELLIYGLLLLAVIGFACALAFNVLRRTIYGITQIVGSMQQLSLDGDLDIQLPAASNDEIGTLSNAMRELVQALGSIATQAEVIGEGDYRNEVAVRSERDRLALGFNRMVENTREVLGKAEAIAAGENIAIRPRGSNDQLGMALVRMSESLSAYEARTRDEQWVNEGQIELAHSASADEDEKDIGIRLVAQISRYVEADAGIIWTWSGERAEFLAGYGAGALERQSDSPPDDAGLVAQTVRDRKSRLISRVPDGYFRVGSGFGSALPSSILVAPLDVGNETVGAVELAFFSAPSARAQKFVETVRSTAASTLQRAQARTRLQELLEKSRQQADQLAKSEAEIQSRSDQLLASNEELGEKTRLLERQASQLRASEEILRNQTEELQVTNEELSERGRELEERTRQIEKAKELVEQKARDVERASQYKSEFLANMSHELRTPLNSMLILSGMLADNDAGNLGDEDVESARIIHESGNNLLSLINDILDLSKVEAGKVELNYEHMRFQDFLEIMRKRYVPVANEKQLKLTLELADGTPEELVTDVMRFEQVVTNLLSNALKFTTQGEVALRISRAEAADFPSPPAPGEYISVAVSDTGIGIPADKVERVFNAFEQADGSTTREFGGTGLGLAISLRLAKLMGGRIVVSSSEGKGSTFRLLVPLEPNLSDDVSVEAPPAELPVPAAPVSGSGQDLLKQVPLEALPPPPIPDDRDAIEPGDQTIVVIDDDIHFLKVLVATVRSNGIRALVAADGRAGLDLIRRYRPCGVFLDIGLPDLDGWSVMERLQADPEIAQIPVHFISGKSEAARAEAMGAVGFATKPVSREDIHGAIRQVLGDAGKSRKPILLINDHPEDRAEIVSQLRAEGLQVEEVESADDALAILARGSEFSCIILNPHLQGKDGWQMLKEAEEAGTYTPPVLIYSDIELTDQQVAALPGKPVAVVIKNEGSRQRLIDEATLFLHHVRKDIATDSPREPEPKPKPKPKPKLVAQDLSILEGKVALVADDDMRNVFALSKVLRRRGMQTLKAPDGQKALQQLKDNADRVDIVLMDIMMPVMDGYDAIREIRKDSRFDELPVIALTAKAMKGDDEVCMQAGATDYQSKPVDIPALLDKMASLFTAQSDSG